MDTTEPLSPVGGWQDSLGDLSLGVKPDNPARALYEGAGFVYTHDNGGYCHYGYPVNSPTAGVPLVRGPAI
jgi:hypothetical protein